MEFVAIDVETANADMASICQIGLTKYRDGILVEERPSLANPEDYFDFINADIHGITEGDVASAPTFLDLFENVSELLSGGICVSHTHFDRVSKGRAINKYSLNPINTVRFDSARVARRAREECAWRGYGFSNECKIIRYGFKHDNALESLKASGQVLIAEIEETGINRKAWLTQVSQPIDLSDPSNRPEIRRNSNPEGELYGETVVYTGPL